MCGIAGAFQYRAADRSPICEKVGLRMTDSLVHRGPDDGGLLVGPGILLGHRRLAIIDLSDDGHQPMPDPSQRYWIVYNGEIYNFQEIRVELEQLGHRFRSRTDTEVILRAYMEWGHHCAQRLNGMFAFAIWDHTSRSLWLVRDPLGIKPLFFHDDGSTLRFGSEAKAILADPTVPRAPDWAALDHFFTFGYTPAPFTGFCGIRQLAPGESLVVTSDGTVHQQWSHLPYPSDATSVSTADEASSCLEQSIDDAVTRQSVSDVPLGALLSGGLDSSIVVRAMRRTNITPLNTFTIGFDDQHFDESPYAQRVADRYATCHHSRTVGSDLAAILPRVLSHSEEPLADNSALPFYLLAEFVRSKVTVALSGDGADELFAGYDTYRASQLARYYRWVPSILRRKLVPAVARRLPTSEKKYALTALLRRFVTGANEPPLRDHCSWRRFLSADLRQAFLPDSYRNDAADPIDSYANMANDAPPWLSPLERQLHIDLKFHLPNDMLAKVDRMSMAHSLEVRVPLLDLRVVQTALDIPGNFKRQGKSGKLPLKSILKNDFDASFVHRRKAGFLVPLEKWMRHDWRDYVHDVLSEQFIRSTGFLQWPAVQQLTEGQDTGREDNAYPLYALFVFALWWRMWISGEDSICPNKPSAKPTRIHRLTSATPAPEHSRTG